MPLLYTAFVVYASLDKYAMGMVPESINGADKIAHATAYLVFVLIWALACRLNKNKEDWKFYLLRIVVLALFLGLLMEVCQYVFTSYRQMDWLDMVANSTGVLLGYLFSIKFILNPKKLQY